MQHVSTAHSRSRSLFFQGAGAVALFLLTALSGVSQPTPATGSKGPFVVLLGAPASGKTTQGNSLGKKYNVPVVHATDVLEKAIRRASSYAGPPNRRQGSLVRAQKARKALDRLRKGELVDDESLNGFVASRISQDDCRNGFVIDGFPNTVDQAVFLDEYLEEQGISNLRVVYLDIPDDVSLARMQRRGRTDDVRGFGKERLAQFRSNVASVLEFYKGAQFLSVDGTKEVAAVTSEIVAFLEKR
jgi:adenylate kinase